MGVAVTSARALGLKVSLVFISTFVALGICEAVVRAVRAGSLYARPWVDERNTLYRYDARLGWFPKEGQGGVHHGFIDVPVQHNARGFRDIEHGAKQKPRLAVIGDSFVWGFDCEADQRFTERLKPLVPDWEVVNLGVSGYGTDQQLVLLKDVFDDYVPDVVLLVFTTQNDIDDNTADVRYVGYYKPYFVMKDGALDLRGVPVPKSINYYHPQYPTLFSSQLVGLGEDLYRRYLQPVTKVPDVTPELLDAMKAYVESKGARLAVAFTDLELYPENGNPGFEYYTRAQLIDLHRKLVAHLDKAGVPNFTFTGVAKYPGSGFHWTGPGNQTAAEQVAAFLEAKNVLARPGSPAVGP